MYSVASCSRAVSVAAAIVMMMPIVAYSTAIGMLSVSLSRPPMAPMVKTALSMVMHADAVVAICSVLYTFFIFAIRFLSFCQRISCIAFSVMPCVLT